MKCIASWLIIGLASSFAFSQTSGSQPKHSAKPAEDAVAKKPDEPAPPKRPVWRPSAAAKLAWRFREISFDDMPLEEVFANISRVCDVNIVVRWNRLADAGIERDAGVSLSVRNMRLSQVLWLLFNQFDPATAKLAYRADRDMILVSTAEDLGGEMLVRVYDIEDLIANRLARPTFAAERVHTAVTGVQPVVAAGAVGVRPITQDWGSGIYINSDDVGSDSPVERLDGTGGGESDNGDQAREARIQQLINVITTTVEPDTWAANGGRGTVLNFRGVLVVRNTPFVHQLLGGPIVESGGP